MPISHDKSQAAPVQSHESRRAALLRRPPHPEPGSQSSKVEHALSQATDAANLKRILLLLGIRPECLLHALKQPDEAWHVELALRSALLSFDGWRARRLAPSASAGDLARALAWFEACCCRLDDDLGEGAGAVG